MSDTVKAAAPSELTDERLSDLFERHVGDATDDLPWTKEDFFNFARAAALSTESPQEAPSERETIIGSAVGRIRATIPVEGESPEKLIEAIAQRVADMAKETWKPWIGGDPKLASPTEKGKE